MSEQKNNAAKDFIMSALRLALFLGLGVFLVWWAIKGFSEEDKRQMLNSLVGVKYGWLVLSMILSVLSNISRAMRWQLMLEPITVRPGLLNSYFSVMVGYLVNLAIPRLGEVSRCTAISKYEKIPFTTAFGTVVTERVIDLLMLLILVVLMLLTQFQIIVKPAIDNLFAPAAEKVMGLFSGKTLFVCFALLLAVIGLWRYRKKTERKRKPSPLTNRIRHFLSNMKEGVLSVRKVKSQSLFWAHTVFIWTCYVLMIFYLHLRHGCHQKYWFWRRFVGYGVWRIWHNRYAGRFGRLPHFGE